jgi:hypothetical protein
MFVINEGSDKAACSEQLPVQAPVDKFQTMGISTFASQCHHSRQADRGSRVLSMESQRKKEIGRSRGENWMVYTAPAAATFDI